MVNEEKGELSVSWPFPRQKRTNFLLCAKSIICILFISIGNTWVGSNDEGV